MNAKIMPLLMLIAFATAKGAHQQLPMAKKEPPKLPTFEKLPLPKNAAQASQQALVAFKAQRDSKIFSEKEIQKINDNIQYVTKERDPKNRAQAAEELLILSSMIAQEVKAGNTNPSMAQLNTTINTALPKLLPDRIAQAATVQELNALIKNIRSVDPLYIAEPTMVKALNDAVAAISVATSDYTHQQQLALMIDELEAIRHDLPKASFTVVTSLIDNMQNKQRLIMQHQSYKDLEPQKLLTTIADHTFSREVAPESLNILANKLGKIDFESASVKEIERQVEALNSLIKSAENLGFGANRAHGQSIQQFKTALETAQGKARQQMLLKQSRQTAGIFENIKRAFDTLAENLAILYQQKNLILPDEKFAEKMAARIKALARKKPSKITLSPENLGKQIANDISAVTGYINSLEVAFNNMEKTVIKPLIAATTKGIERSMVPTTEPYQKIQDGLTLIEQQVQEYTDIKNTLQAMAQMNVDPNNKITGALAKTEALLQRFESNKKALETNRTVLQKAGFTTA